MNQLEEVGLWLEVNGEAIYETRPRPGDLWKEGADVSFAAPRPEDVAQPPVTRENASIRLTSEQGWKSGLRHLLAMARFKAEVEDRSGNAKYQDYSARCERIIEMAR
jgi:hypothetical protein